MHLVEGTMPRGYSLYQYENSNLGYDLAKKDLQNPLEDEEINMVKAKELYDIYCGVCHGNKGDGQGILMKREKMQKHMKNSLKISELNFSKNQ